MQLLQRQLWLSFQSNFFKYELFGLIIVVQMLRSPAHDGVGFFLYQYWAAFSCFSIKSRSLLSLYKITVYK